jgi:hypothetical protein
MSAPPSLCTLPLLLINLEPGIDGIDLGVVKSESLPVPVRSASSSEPYGVYL